MVSGNGFADVSRQAPDLPRTLRGILESGDEALERARELSSSKPDGTLDEVELLPVIPDPPAVWCVGVNYDAHRKETGREPTEHPTLFLRIGCFDFLHNLLHFLMNKFTLLGKEFAIYRLVSGG